MLIELSIKNFAIIENLTVPFEKGLTVLTGETGAGKSIIIDAISLLVGGRGSVEFVRHGANRAEIQGLFFIDNLSHDIYDKALQLGIEINDDQMVVLQRDITSQGKSICRVNGKLVTLGILRELGESLVDIHGQHEHQHLMQVERHLSLLDQFIVDKISDALNEYKNIYKTFTELKGRVKQFSENEQKIAHRLDLLQYQLKEIEKSNLTPDEDVHLTEERFKLSNGEKLYKTIHDSYHALYGDGKGLDWLMDAMNHVVEAATIDKQLIPLKETISNCYYLLEEATFSLRDYYEGIEFDPDRLNLIEGRLNEISQLKRKYGHDVTHILEYSSKIEEEIDNLLNREAKIEEIQNQLEHVSYDLYLEAKNLTQIRTTAAKDLGDKIQQHLKDLYMEKTKFYIEVSERAASEKDPAIDGKYVHFQEDGIDKVEFLLSTNPGEPLKPLAKIASGGEISRIMLALKSIFSSHHGVTSLIFDEVDTGVSGRVAQAIAEKIYKISTDSQVLCITHLPQVAAMATTHLYISKEQLENKTVTKVATLTKLEQVEEVARMLSGAETTKLTRENAKELLDQAEKIKGVYVKLTN
ncbi:DNA repair protein RecN [Anaerobacillus isosaccharinicus]|uniref:DNA repair protein RecN n=1 Tax=Anaerobacillus isosaccharinicus TaxID=1532552 RepID=A0A1S2MFC8_9BACI|nr:DNA repair protein RecN [Anaerobacillus isosaccharinicus]MBA5585631.1 DNA repair protein RecN [Anaerobacillus isosaccharinicus]QOY36060.1 DNA repair protein RecN [Anaerobacillus isosaccharinicus]